MAAHRKNSRISCLFKLPIGFISAELQSYCKKMNFDKKSVMDHKYERLKKINEKLSAINFKTKFIMFLFLVLLYQLQKFRLIFALFLVSEDSIVRAILCTNVCKQKCII
jgi:hypothetical protein